jgi:uracil-DNA glycosylase family 4
MPLFSIKGCDVCSLKSEWPKLSHPVMPTSEPFQDVSLRILVVGEAPGEKEDEEGVPFVGKGGQFLREHMPRAWRNNVYYTNICRCRPPKDRDLSDQEILACTAEFLERDIDRIKPHIIIPVGNVALSYFCPGYRLSVLRGIFMPVELEGGRAAWLYPILEPFDMLPDAGRFNSKPGQPKFSPAIPVFKSDLRRLFDNIEQRLDPPVLPVLPEVICPQSIHEAEGIFTRMAGNIGIDFETSKLKAYHHDAKLLTCGMSDGKLTMAFPIDWPGIHRPWGRQFLQRIARAPRTYDAHNMAMELLWMRWTLGEYPACLWEDSMMKPKFIFNREDVYSLDTQTLIYHGRRIKDATDDELGRALRRKDERILRIPLSDVLKYNGWDAWGSNDLIKRQQLPKNQVDNYFRAIKAVHSTVNMEIRGLDIDFEQTNKLRSSLDTQAQEIERRVHRYPVVNHYEEVTGSKFNLGAPQDVWSLLTNFCKLDLRTERERSKQNHAAKRGNTVSVSKSSDEAHLESHRDVVIVADILEYREILKQKSTYVDPIITTLIGVDGKMHPSYNVTLTATGRLSCDSPNIQNFPSRKHKEVRRQIVPPPGYIMVSGDYGQLEARVIGMSSRDINLCRSIIKKEDIHTKWLNTTIDIHPGYMDRLRRMGGVDTDKAARKAGRTIIKTDLVFASFYGAKMESVAQRTGIPNDVCAKIFDKFWAEYADVKKWVDGRVKEYVDTGSVKTLTELTRNEVLPGNEPVNTPMQGTAAHIVIEAQNAIFDLSRERQDPNLEPRMNIHDDISWFIPDTDESFEYINTVGTEMAKPRFLWSILPLMVEIKVGVNWCDLEVVGEFEGDYIRE